MVKVNEIDDVGYKSGWKPVIRENADHLPLPGNVSLNPHASKKINENIKHPKNDDNNSAAQYQDMSAVLSQLENYNNQINKKLDDIINELNTLISLILEMNTQKTEEKPSRIKKLFSRKSSAN
ncbi:MAG TPA: hypothetical protein GXX20_07965 [Clostridiaceae bacterium]|nr:hypothetical protein [Clostridiaceae bacterium]